MFHFTRDRSFAASTGFSQLRRIRKSLDDESAAVLVHAFVTSRIDYCNALYTGAPKRLLTSCNECSSMLPPVWSVTHWPHMHLCICNCTKSLGDFVQLQILGVRGPKSKIEKRFVECHMKRWWPKNGSVPSRNKKRRIDLKEQRDRQTDRQTESTTTNNRLDPGLGAEINMVLRTEDGDLRRKLKIVLCSSQLVFTTSTTVAATTIRATWPAFCRS